MWQKWPQPKLAGDAHAFGRLNLGYGLENGTVDALTIACQYVAPLIRILYLSYGHLESPPRPARPILLQNWGKPTLVKV